VGNDSFSTFVNLDGGTAGSQCTSLGAAKADGSAYQTFCQFGGNQASPDGTTMLNTAAADGTVVFGPFEVLSTP
jgi:hypothetical protein